MKARIRFLTTDEGGRSAPPRSGYHPQLKLGDIYTSCFVKTLFGHEEQCFELGREYEVELELLFPHYAHLVPETDECELYEGSRLVASGRFLRSQ